MNSQTIGQKLTRLQVSAGGVAVQRAGISILGAC